MTIRLAPVPEWAEPEDLELRLTQTEAEVFLLREQLRRAQAESEEFHLWVGRVLESLPLGLVWSDGEGRVRSMNQSAEGLLGLRRDAARGRTYGELWPDRMSPADRLRIGAPRVEAVDGARAADGPMRLDSEVSWVRGARGEMLGAVEILADRTEAQRLREELETSRALAALGRVAAVAAHEIRNPLGGMSGFLDLLERDLEPGDARLAHASKIRSGIQALEKLVSEFLEFTRPAQTRRDPVDLCDLAESAVAEVEVLARHSNVGLEWRRPRAAVVLGDAARLQGAVTNLLRNAVEASPEGGRVTVRLLPGETHRLTVSDEGPGVDPALRPRMFEPFVTGKARGTGLGLALASRAAQTHQGVLAYRERHPHGACFELALPATGGNPR
jgi:PAS domain S-box-containing protein